MHLGRSVVDPERPELPCDLRDRKISRDAQAAAELDGTVDNPVESLPREGLGDGGRVRRAVSCVQLLTGTKEEGAGRGKVDLVVRDHLLGHPEVCQRRAERPSLAGVGDGDLVRTASRSRPPHHVCHAGRAEPHLCVAEALVDLAENIVVGNEEIREDDLAVSAQHGPVHGGDVPDDVDLRTVRRREEHRGSPEVAGLAAGASHDDEHPGPVCPRDEVLPPVDQPAAIDALRCGRQCRGIGSRTRGGFGHRECRALFTSDDGPQIPVPLSLGRHMVQEMDVALIRCGDVESRRTE